MKPPAIETPDLLFSQSSRYRAPVFQRLYVWEAKELDALIDDIVSGEPDAPEFLGAIVLVDLGKPKGATSPSSYLIIDGQQRLTTLYLILAALAELAREKGEVNTADYIRDEYLAQSKSPEFRGQPKLVPTYQDRTTLWEILKRGQPGIEWEFGNDPGDGNAHRPQLESQWKRIKRAIRNQVLDKRGALVAGKLDEFLQHLQNGLSFITITLQESDDANEIFSKLNAKGVPLGLVDLVRNDVFSKFGPTKAMEAERFYSESWHPFERRFAKGTLDAYFPVFAYIVFEGQVTKAEAFPKLQARWSKMTAPQILDDLAKYAPYFQALVSGSAIDGVQAEINDMIDRVARMPRSIVTWPYLIQVLASARNTGSDKGHARCLSIVEAFLVRRAITGVEPTGLHAVFKSLWVNAGVDPKELLGKITTRTITCPGEKELADELSTSPVDTRVILPYVLEEYERDVRKAQRYDPITKTVATIEHVMPKARGTKWPKIADAKKHDALVGELGNLVALSETQNKSVQDDPWEKKRSRFRGSNFVTTQKIADLEKWDESTIHARTAELIGWMQGRWPSLTAFGEQK